jgi:NADP-dependent 3-hydroxy acid dehydrogenase YdfG
MKSIVIVSLLVVVLLESTSCYGFSPKRSFLNMKTTNVIAGSTGYIGKSVVRESVRQGCNTIALVRDKSKVESPEGQALYGTFFQGATIVECDVTDPQQVEQVRMICFLSTVWDS